MGLLIPIFWLLSAGCQLDSVATSTPAPADAADGLTASSRASLVSARLSLFSRSDSHEDVYSAATSCRRLADNWKCSRYSSRYAGRPDDADLEWTVLSDTSWNRMLDTREVSDLLEIEQPDPRTMPPERGSRRKFVVAGDGWVRTYGMRELPAALKGLVKDFQGQTADLEMQEVRYTIPMERPALVGLHETAWIDEQYGLKLARCEHPTARIELWKKGEPVGHLKLERSEMPRSWKVAGFLIQVDRYYCGRKNYASVAVSAP